MILSGAHATAHSYGFWHGVAVFFGVTNASGTAYLAWSGILSDLGEVTLVAGLIAVYRRHNCHARWCLRVGRHSIDGTPYVVCHRHHPEHATMPKRPTVAFLTQLHREVRDPWPGA